ncbi:hypothetical protein JCM12298_25330 [Desulfothermus naphthae]
MRRAFINCILVLLFLLPEIPCFGGQPGFTQEDRERLVRLEATLKVFMEQVDKRFEQVDKRISELREDVNKRFEEMREDMNKRFEQVDKRFEQVDKRFEQVDKRFEEMMTFLWMLVGIFTTLTAVVIGFAYWDRRTIIRKARDEAIETIEREGRLKEFIKALRAYASEDEKFATVLRSFGLL